MEHVVLKVFVSACLHLDAPITDAVSLGVVARTLNECVNTTHRLPHIYIGKIMRKITLAAFIVTSALSASVFAQTVATEVQRDVNQQNRVEEGLKSGQLSTKEAARIEGREAAIQRTEANAMKDGTLSKGEKAHIQRMQNQESRQIYKEKHDAQKGNPNSASSKRMQADVQRNVNQQTRIENGVKDGSLTNREVSHLESHEARISRTEARAGRDGHVGKAEQGKVQGLENNTSKRIYNQRHDAQVRN